jgi:hypothetical protein
MHRTVIDLYPSKQFLLGLVFILVLTCGIIVYLPITLILKFFLCGIVIFYSVMIFWKHGLLKAKHSIESFYIDKGSWQIRDKTGVFSAELSGDSTITTMVCILCFQLADTKKKRFSLVFTDSLKKDEYRRLMVKLRTNAAYQAEWFRKTRVYTVSTYE